MHVFCLCLSVSLLLHKHERLSVVARNTPSEVFEYSYDVFNHPAVPRCLLTYLLHGAESFLRSQVVLQLLKKFPAFLEPESSSPFSQVPATCPYPEPTPSSPHKSPPHFLKIHLNIIFPSVPGSPQRSLSLRSPHQNPVHPSPFPHTRHMLRSSHSSRFYHPHNIR